MTRASLAQLAIALLAVSWMQCATGCRELNATEALDCVPYVKWRVPSALNQSEAALNATWDAQPDPNSCPFYHTLNFQCLKYFPKCSNDTNEQVVKVCQDS